MNRNLSQISSLNGNYTNRILNNIYPNEPIYIKTENDYTDNQISFDKSIIQNTSNCNYIYNINTSLMNSNYCNNNNSIMQINRSQSNTSVINNLTLSYSISSDDDNENDNEGK